MPKKSAKVEKILDIAIELLRTEGDFGVTMRKVASTVDMSLSNVQYYFKTKDDLLKAMADRYFEQCLEDLTAQPVINNSNELKPLIAMLLSHVYETSDMCRIFREYWAISTRNDTMESYLHSYYQSMAEIMTVKLSPLGESQEKLAHAVSILIPFVEGYSITAKSLPSELETMIELLDGVIRTALKSDS